LSTAIVLADRANVPGVPGFEAGRDGSAWRQNDDGSWRPARVYVNRRRYGYRYVVEHVGGRTVSRALHVMVLSAFRGPRPEGMQACHRDDDKSNNCIDNLRWDTPASNYRDRRRNGGDLLGSRCGFAKLSESDVAEMRRLRCSGLLVREIAARFGVHEETARRNIKRRNWKHVA
jgi:hypothetical protein